MVSSKKLGQKRTERKKASQEKVLKKRLKLREEAKLKKELEKIRSSCEEKLVPIRNNYVLGVNT